MPPKKPPAQPGRLRRSGRHAVIEDNTLSEAEATEESHTADAHKPKTAMPVNVGFGDPDDDTVMEDVDAGVATVVEPTSSSSLPPQPPPSTTQPPVQRLSSILSPSSASSSSHQPPSHPQPPTSAPTDPSQPRPPTLKFKPKAIVRRSKEEREAAEQEERERLAARHAATRDSSGQGRGRGRGRAGYDGRGGIGRGAGGGGPLSQGYGGYGFSGNNRADGSMSRRGGIDPRVASGPLGGATVDVGRKKGKWSGTGVEEVSGDEGGGNGDEMGEAGGAASKGKGKGKGKVKEETGVEPESAGKDGEEEIEAGAGAGKKGKRKRDSKAAGTGAGGGKAKGRAKVKKEEDAPTYISSEGEFDSDTAEKINIEAINLVSSEDEADGESDAELHSLSAVARGKQKEMELARAVRARKAKNWMNRPVHVERLEHVERAVGVNTDASSLTSAELRRRAKERKDGEGGLFIDEVEPDVSSGVRKSRRKPKDVEFVRDERKWKGVYTDEDDEGQNDGGVRIKAESTEDTAIADVERVLEKDDEVPGAEVVEADYMNVDAAVQEITAAAAAARDALEGAKFLDKEADANVGGPTDEEDATDEVAFDISTDEEDIDDLDLEIAEDDLEEDESYSLSNCQPEWKNLLEQYTHSKHSEPANPTDLKPPTESTFKANSEESKASRYHKTYLVQLPPLIPSLRDALTKPIAPKKEKKPKSEPAPASTNPPFTAPHPQDIIKEETPPPPPTTTTDHQKIPNAIHQPAHASDFTSGTAGTLTFYDSGRTVASWGDLTFEVTQEREAVGLAQEAMMMEYAKVVTKNEDHGRWEDVITVGGQGEKEEQDGGKVGYSGGRVGGGFCMLGV